MKRLFAILLSFPVFAACLPGLAAAGTASEKSANTPAQTPWKVPFEYVVETQRGEENTIGDEQLIDEIVKYFMPIAEIPRQSHHEEQISEYLASWAEERGFRAERDQEGNVIFDVPGSEGMENAPITILQAHMDMVIAVADGKNFDPQKDGITVINDGTVIKGDGTSLGADDGIGIAAILYFIDTNKAHGPLRIIFTVNEEDGMTGAFGLAPDTVAGAKYLINLDSENSQEVTNSSAAGVVVNFSYEPESAAPAKKQAAVITISGLLSGHSGVDIDKGHVNAIKVVFFMLNRMVNEGIDYELASLKGGNANNAIPAKASACIVYNPEDEAAVEKYVEDFRETFAQILGGIEINFAIGIEKCDLPDAVLTEKSKANVLRFGEEIFNGVNSMSSYVDGLVESSSNFGLVSIEAGRENKSTASTYVRSSDGEKLSQLVENQMSLTKECGFEATATKTADPWPVNPDSKLLEMVKEAYLKETGTEISVVQIHAGLETGTFAKLNPDLDIVSIGFDVKNPHTVSEVCYVKTIPTTYRTLETVLAEIGKETQ